MNPLTLEWTQKAEGDDTLHAMQICDQVRRSFALVWDYQHELTTC